MYSVCQGDHVLEKNVRWWQSLSAFDNNDPSLAEVLKAAKKEFPGIPLNRLRIRATVNYGGVQHLPVIVLDVK